GRGGAAARGRTPARSSAEPDGRPLERAGAGRRGRRRPQHVPRAARVSGPPRRTASAQQKQQGPGTPLGRHGGPVPGHGTHSAREAGLGVIREKLAGKRILLTGVTGFLGQALLERLLAEVPEGRLVLVIRPRAGSDGRSRAEGLLAQPVFNSLRERVGTDGL